MVVAKRKLVAAEEGRVRAECEAIWSGYERARSDHDHEPKREADEPVQERRRSVSGNAVSFAVGSVKEQRGFLAERARGESPHEDFVPSSPTITSPDDPAPPSLLSVSMSTSNFPSFLARERESRPNAASSSLSPSPRPLQSVSPRSPKSPHQDNPIIAPIHLPKYGPDKDIASSLMISNLEGLYNSRSRSHDSPEQFSSRRKNRGFNPLDTDLDEADPAELDPERTRLDSLVAREPEVRPGGEGDITLNPFAESTQASAASSYKSDNGEDKPLAALRGRRSSKDERQEGRGGRHSRTRGSFEDDDARSTSRKGDSRSPRKKEKGKTKSGEKKKSVTFQTPDEPTAEDRRAAELEQIPEVDTSQYTDLASAGTEGDSDMPERFAATQLT